MKKELIELAKEKGFESINLICLQSDNNFAGLDDELTYYLWLCELQKWILDNHNFYINTVCFVELGFYSLQWYYSIVNLLNLNHIESKLFDTREQSLEVGCYESLKLIK